MSLSKSNLILMTGIFVGIASVATWLVYQSNPEAQPGQACITDDELLYAAGLRRSEVVAMDLAHWDSENGGLKIVASKGNKARTVYLENGAKAAVVGWTAVRGGELGPLLYRIRKGGTMVPEWLTDQAIWVILEKRFRQAKVKPFTPHDLRRTFAGEMLDAGVDLVTVQKLMGHASPVTTSRYDRRDEKTKMEAATKIHFPMS